MSLFPVKDLSEDDLERVSNLCTALVGFVPCVLHGSSVQPPLLRIDPRQANDRGRESGNFCAVYASTNVYAVLLHATLNRAYLDSVLESYMVGYRIQGTERVLRVSDNLYWLLQCRDPDIFTDGFIYVLEPMDFISAAGSSHEYYCTHAVVPQGALKVAGRLGWEMFSLDKPEGNANVTRY